MRPAVVGFVAALLSVGCGGRAGPAGGPDDAGRADAGAPVDAPAAGDARPRDAAGRTDGLATGRPCSFDGGCAAGYTCWFSAPGGYCLVGPPTTCTDSSVCPDGTSCSPLPMSQMAGICLLACQTDADCRPGYQCALVYLFPGEPNSPHSDGTVCWVKPVCTPGQDQTCNANPLQSSLAGYCQPDGTCLCKPGYQLDPGTGKCG